jgi:hypothetical protein
MDDFDNLTPITVVAIIGRVASSNGVDIRISGFSRSREITSRD